MRKALLLSLVAAMVSSLLTSCGMNSMSSGMQSSSQTAPVSLTMTDDPPAGVSVLFFQVSLTDASLMPSSGTAVSLLNNNTPIQIDVTQLQALSAFLSTANVPAGTYSSLNLTFASPQLVIFNDSDQAIASTCAVGTVCQLTPTIDNSATVTLSTAPFPVTVATNSPLGFLVDFHLNTIIQSDLSVNLGASNGVTLKQLPSTGPMQPPPFGFVAGTVESVMASSNQFTLQTAWGRTFTIDSGSSTTYDDFPMSACATGSISCVASGQIVRVQVASVVSTGILMASQVTYLQAAGQQTVEGTIVDVLPPPPTVAGTAGLWTIKLILHRNPTNNSGLPLGGEASVSIASNATYSIDANGFTIPSGLTFTGGANLGVGQTVQVNVVSGSLGPVTSPMPMVAGEWSAPRLLAFTTSTVELEPGQITGTVSGLGSASFTLSGFPSICFGPRIAANATSLQSMVETTSQTTYQGFSMDSFSGLANGDVVSVSGWLFPQNGVVNPAVGPPTVLAEAISLHSDGWF